MQGLTVTGIITTFLIDIMAGSVHDHAINHLIDNLRKGGKPVNHDLQKAVRLSFFSALQEIIRECHQALMRSAERKFPMLPADYPKEHRSELEWLDDRFKELTRKIRQIQKKNFTEGLPETAGEIESLLNPTGLTAEKRILAAKEKLIDEALNDKLGSECYENTVRGKLFDRVRDYFVREIKHTANVRHIFDSQLLVQIKSALKDLMEEEHQNKYSLERIEKRLAIIEELSEPSAIVKIHFDRNLDEFSTPELFWLIEEAQQIVKIRMLRSESGSIVLVFDGSLQECEQIRKMFNEGKLKEIAGIPIEHVSFEGTLLSKEEFSDVRDMAEKAVGHLKKWVSDLWSPQWAGVPVGGGDIPEQTQIFQTKYGEVEITCSWYPGYGKNPAYMQISWRTNLMTEADLGIQFVNPETEAILSEKSLGKYSEDGKYFTSEDLGFDPLKEKWAISVFLI